VKAEIDEIERLAKAATPGPWTVKSEWTGEHSGADVVYGSTGRAVAQCDEHDGEHGGGERNVEFIAAANPAAVLELIAEMRRLSVGLARVVTKLDAERLALKAMLCEALNAWEREAEMLDEREPDRVAIEHTRTRIAELRRFVEP
jgi:hypothetical protein